MEAIENDVSPEDLPSKCQSLRIRSIRKRIETEKNKLLPKTRRPRERPAPLSKYRRRTANARERQRMQEVNVAFEKLKSTIPHHKLKQIDEKKDTKITTLRCAITYINSLSELLEDIEKGKSVSPEYYFTDAQLGLEPENKKKKRNQKGKDYSQHRNKREQDGRKKRNFKINGIDIAKHLEHINLPEEIKILLANGINKAKRINKSTPYMIDNRPKMFKTRKKILPNQLIYPTNVTCKVQEHPKHSVLQNIICNDQQSLIKADCNDTIHFPKFATASKPVVVAKRNNLSPKYHRYLKLPIRNYECHNTLEDAQLQSHMLLTRPPEVRLSHLTPIDPSDCTSSPLTAHLPGVKNGLKPSPPESVLAMARGTSIDMIISPRKDTRESFHINGNHQGLPFSTKGLQPLNSLMIQQLILDSNLSTDVSSTSPLTTTASIVSTVPSNFPASPSSSSNTPSLSPSFFSAHYQLSTDDDKIDQDHYPVSDDIAELTPSFTTGDLEEHQLNINGVDYSNVDSIQEFLVDFEQSPSQQVILSDQVIERTICS